MNSNSGFFNLNEPFEKSDKNLSEFLLYDYKIVSIPEKSENQTNISISKFKKELKLQIDKKKPIKTKRKKIIKKINKFDRDDFLIPNNVRKIILDLY